MVEDKVSAVILTLYLLSPIGMMTIITMVPHTCLPQREAEDGVEEEATPMLTTTMAMKTITITMAMTITTTAVATRTPTTAMTNSKPRDGAGVGVVPAGRPCPGGEAPPPHPGEGLASPSAEVLEPAEEHAAPGGGPSREAVW